MRIVRVLELHLEKNENSKSIGIGFGDERRLIVRALEQTSWSLAMTFLSSATLLFKKCLKAWYFKNRTVMLVIRS